MGGSWVQERNVFTPCPPPPPSQSPVSHPPTRPHPTRPHPTPTPPLLCSDLEQSVRDDVALLRASPLVAPGTPITGGVYDVHTGKITWLE